ncbi:MAG TPA: adenylate/guanylate cyclase domain-containing protein [Actinomycetes bacterium]|nr:adenylate/guanylate cyclase domain-containing protein [Actinomycetes bacterium]
MPTCHVCRLDNPAGARFCNACGSPLDGEARPLRQERKVVTVLFADLVGFTARSDRMDPEDVQRLLQPYHAHLRSVLERHGGTVAKFVGDAVMAIFGAPVAHEDDPERAVRAALAIREDLAADGDLEVHIGITTGEALITLDAKIERGEHTASGDSVNTAARLESAAPAGSIFVDEATRRATERSIEFDDAPPVVAKGKSDPIRVWDAVRPRTPVAGRQASDTPLVGREQELTLLRGTFDRVQREREPQLLTLLGVPGIGKTRLVSELARELDRHGDWRWLEGRSLPYGEGATFWAFCEIVRAFTGVLDSDGDEGATRKVHGAVASVVPEPSEAAWLERHLRPLVGIDTDDLGSGDRRGEAFAAWRRLLEALAEERPLVLVFDDLHWADDALLDFVDHVVDWASGVPILVLATARPDLLDRRPGWGGGRANATAIRLSPLSPEETARLFNALFAGSGAPREMRADLLERAGGNPFYAEEFARMVVDGRGDRALPESVQGLIAARLDGLAPDEKELLQNAAVVGRVFWAGPLGEDRPRLEEALHALARREFVRRERRSSIAGETEYSFRHALIRDVAYEQIPKARRAEKHLAAAGWIEALSRREDYAEMLSSHYLRAVEYAGAGGVVSEELVERAVRALRDAGDRALSLHAYPLAAGFYERAIVLQPDGAPGARRELLLALGDALARAGDQARARETFLTAAELARRSGSAEHLARAALGYGGRFVWSRAWGDPHLVPLLEEALALLDDTDGDLRVRLLARLAAGPLRDTTPLEPREAMSDEALRMARRLGDRAALAYALEGRHGANMYPGTVDRRRAIAEELIAVAEQIEDTERAYAGHEYRFHALLETGDVVTARQAFDAMTRIAEELRQPAQLWFAGVNRAKLALFEGRFDDAEDLIRAAFELGQRDWTANPQMAFDLQMYQLKRERGLLGEMVDVVERAVEAHPAYPVWRYVLLDVDTELGREDRARATFERLAAEGFPLYLEMQWLFGMSLLPEVCRYLDDPDGASAVYAQLQPFGRLNATLPPELCRGSVSRGLGILAATMARWSEAVEHFEVAVRMNAEMAARPWLAHTQYDYARALLRRGEPGDRGQVAELLRAAAASAQELGMRSLADKVSSLG